MLPCLATLLLLPIGAFAAAVSSEKQTLRTTTLSLREVSPDNTCGGDNGYTCPEELACCSQHGYCGATDEFCLTTAGCQADYSNSTAACHEPVPGESVSVDGTCGTEGAGTEGYRCPANATVTSCCSAS
ncbi:carbohydrate-binding module family 18 protein [Corynascus similis CBS 632.67]